MNERGQGWQDLAGKWNSMTSDGPKITLTLEPTPTGTNTLIEKVTASYSAGVQPDLLHSAYWDGGVYGVQGMAVELDSTFIKRDKAYRDLLADFFPHLLESSKWRGQAVEPAAGDQRRPALHQPGAGASRRAAAAQGGLHVGPAGRALQGLAAQPGSEQVGHQRDDRRHGAVHQSAQAERR